MFQSVVLISRLPYINLFSEAVSSECIFTSAIIGKCISYVIFQTGFSRDAIVGERKIVGKRNRLKLTDYFTQHFFNYMQSCYIIFLLSSF